MSKQPAATKQITTGKKANDPQLPNAKPFLDHQNTSIRFRVNGVIRQYGPTQAQELANDIRSEVISAEEVADKRSELENWPPTKMNPHLLYIVSRMKRPTWMPISFEDISNAFTALTSKLYQSAREETRRRYTKNESEVSARDCALNFAPASRAIFRTVYRRAAEASVMLTQHPTSKHHMEEHIRTTVNDVSKEEDASNALDALKNPFNTCSREVYDSLRALTELRCREVMTDGEGREIQGPDGLYPENISRINQLLVCTGNDEKRQTPRIPNPTLEPEAYAIYLREIILANFEQLQKDEDLGIWRSRLAIYELIVPQINKLSDITVLKRIRKDLKECVKDLLAQKREEGFVFDNEEYEEKLNKLRLIPLLEDANLLVHIQDFIKGYHTQGFCISTKIAELPRHVFEHHVEEGYISAWLKGILLKREGVTKDMVDKVARRDKSVLELIDACPEAELYALVEEAKSSKKDKERIKVYYSRICKLWYKLKQEKELERRMDRPYVYKYGKLIPDAPEYEFTDERERLILIHGTPLTVTNIEQLLDLVVDNRVARFMIAGSDVPLKSGITKARTAELLAGNGCCKAQKYLDRVTVEHGEDEIFVTLIAGKGDNPFRGNATTSTGTRSDPNRFVSDALLQLLRYYTCITLQGSPEDLRNDPTLYGLFRSFVTQLKVLPTFYDLLPDAQISPGTSLRDRPTLLQGPDAYRIVKEHAGEFQLPYPRNEEVGFLPKEMEEAAMNVMALGEIAYLRNLPHVVEAAYTLSDLIPTTRPRKRAKGKKSYNRAIPEHDDSNIPEALKEEYSAAHSFCTQNWPMLKEDAIKACQKIRGFGVPSEVSELANSLEEHINGGNWSEARKTVQTLENRISELDSEIKDKVMTTLARFKNEEFAIPLVRPISFNGSLTRCGLSPALLDVGALIDILTKPELTNERKFINTFMPGYYAYAVRDEVFFSPALASLVLKPEFVRDIKNLLSNAREINELGLQFRVDTDIREHFPSEALPFVFTAKLLLEGKRTDLNGETVLFSDELTEWAFEHSQLGELGRIYFDSPYAYETLACWSPKPEINGTVTEYDPVQVVEGVKQVLLGLSESSIIRGPSGIKIKNIKSIPTIAWRIGTLG